MSPAANWLLNDPNNESSETPKPPEAIAEMAPLTRQKSTTTRIIGKLGLSAHWSGG
jgi:hypothetical protein